MVEYVHLSSEFEERNVGPVVVARKVHERIMEGGDSRVVAELADITINDNQFGGFQLKLGFHQRQVDGVFKFDPNVAEREPIGDTTSKASTVQELDDEIGLLASLIEEAYGANPWEFASLEAASIGGTGALTDYEFKYETSTSDGRVEKDSMDKAIEKIT